MLIVFPGDRSGNLSPNSAATRATSSPLSSTRASPRPWIPFVWLRSFV